MIWGLMSFVMIFLFQDTEDWPSSGVGLASIYMWPRKEYFAEGIIGNDLGVLYSFQI